MNSELENGILSACALRFDGYKYQEATRYDPASALNDFWRTGEWPSDPLKQLASFFFLQRFLCKWGGETLPKNCKYWQAYRSLFLLVNTYDIPKTYRISDWFERWQADFKPQLALYVVLIHEIHSSTLYNDDAPPLA
jgi:hypothetical protein